jgi:Outer membrane protein beta-barrel domain
MNTIKLAMMMLIFTAASSLHAQTTIGISAGASFSTVRVKAQGVSASPKSRTGIACGVYLDASLGNHLSFQPALNFVQKGYTIKEDPGTEKVNFNYIELPINFVYTVKRNEGVFIGAGPSLSYGISGKDKFKYNGTGMPDHVEKIKFGSGGDEVKAIDFGVNAIAGYTFKSGFVISGCYSLGLSNISNNSGPDETGTIKNRYYSLKVGYRFSGKKVK